MKMYAKIGAMCTFFSLMYGGNARLPEGFKLVLSQPNADELGTTWRVAQKDGELFTTVPGDHGFFFCFRPTEFFKLDEVRAVASLSGKTDQMSSRELGNAIAEKITTSQEVSRTFARRFIADCKKSSLKELAARCAAVSDCLKDY